jgi:hypothetical protein
MSENRFVDQIIEPKRLSIKLLVLSSLIVMALPFGQATAKPCCGSMPPKETRRQQWKCTANAAA